MQRGYRPDNARLVVVGDFDAHALLKTIEHLFGSLENPGVRLPELVNVSPRNAPSHVTIAAPVRRSSVDLLWDIPEALQPQLAGLWLLRAELLISLRQALVETPGLAVDVGVTIHELTLGWLWSVRVELLPGIDPKFVEGRVLATVARLRGQTLATEALETARERALTSLLEGWDDPSSRAALLSSARFGFDISQARSDLKRVSAAQLAVLAKRSLPAKPRLSVHVRRALDAARRGELYREPE